MVLKFFKIYILLFSIVIVSQELPPIENFTPIDYGAQNQNWGVAQSNQNSIYAANNSGLLEFNGATWQLHPSPNGSTIRSVRATKNIVYTGCYMEFGLWKKNGLGDLIYQSISSKLNVPILEDEEFWNILILEDWVLFQSLERIYIYNTLSQEVQIIESISSKAQMFIFKGTVYYQTEGKGLFKIENGISVLVSEDKVIRESIISGVFSLQDKLLLVTESGRFYFLEKSTLYQWDTPYFDGLSSITVYSSLQLANGSIVLGTISNGIYIINKDGKVVLTVNKEKGLNNNTVLSIFEDTENNLWLALDNGISVINMNSHFNEYSDRNGDLGVVYSSTLYKDFLYLGTNQGLFYKNITTDEDFKFIKGTKGQVWLLKTIGDVLFCGHNNGTYVIEQDAAQLISSFPGTWDIKSIPNRENMLLQGNFKGLSILSKNNDVWSLKNVIDGFDISSRFFEFTGNNQVIVNREFKGIFNLKLDSEFTNVIESSNEPSKGYGACLITYLDEVLYACDNGIYKYDTNEEHFVADAPLTDLFYGNSNPPVGIFIADNQQRRLWAFTNTDIVYAAPGKFRAEPQVDQIAIPSHVRRNFGVLGFENLKPIGEDKYLIGISNGYLTLDLKKLIKKEYSIHINSISKKSKASVWEKIQKDSVVNFGFSNNNLLFSFNVPEFEKYAEVKYQYQLEGLYNEWSPWGNTSEVSFENLPYGNYSFNLRAKVGNELTVNTASYKFRIQTPWYLSKVAIFQYIISIIMLAALIHRLYKNYYKKQRELLLKENRKKLKRKELKVQKRMVQIKNERLNEQLESKNRELAISTMSIIKKNEFLNAIKNQLKDDQTNPNIRAVIKTIDRNIANEDDWKFFEDAFNNADKEFLKKIKGAHPELTSNDLRLCAYLRLNLSSKEIAPLLNISVKSVEVKRYRLRKKMNLLHEDSLTDYIMSL
jgi:DNA-binding CsgD family transcriptional regulator